VTHRPVRRFRRSWLTAPQDRCAGAEEHGVP
jgi:hypothetical protein